MLGLAGTKESLKFLAIPVLPVLLLLAGITIFNNEEDSKKILRIRMLRADAVQASMIDRNEKRALVNYERAWDLERSVSANTAFIPASYYDCARIYARSKKYTRSRVLLQEGAKLLERRKSNNSTQALLIAQERLRVWTMLGEVELASHNYDEAQKCFERALAAVPLGDSLWQFSPRVVLRLSGRGWGKLPQCRQADGTYNADAVNRLTKSIAPKDLDFLAAILDTSATNQNEYAQWWEVDKDVTHLLKYDKPRAKEELATFVNAVPDRPVDTAQRLFRAADILALYEEYPTALDYFKRSLALSRNALLKNKIAIAETERSAGMAAAYMGSHKAALELLAQAMNTVRELVPPDRFPLTKAAISYYREAADQAPSIETLPMLEEQYRLIKQNYLDRKAAADDFAASANWLGTQLYGRHGKPDDSFTRMEEALKILKAQNERSVYSGKLLSQALIQYYDRSFSVDPQTAIKLLQRAITTYQDYKSISAPGHDSEVANLSYFWQITARLQLLNGNFDQAYQSASKAMAVLPEPLFWQKPLILETQIDSCLSLKRQALAVQAYKEVERLVADKTNILSGGSKQKADAVLVRFKALQTQ